MNVKLDLITTRQIRSIEYEGSYSRRTSVCGVTTSCIWASEFDIRIQNEIPAVSALPATARTRIARLR